MGISAVIAGVGAAAGIGGAVTNVMASQQASKSNSAIAQLQMQEDQQRREAMELDAKRQQLQVVRTQQQARAMALTNATAQGAQYGSGLPGGYGNVSGQSTANLLGINQSLAIGENMFNLNGQIDQQRMNLASAQGLSGIGTGMQMFGNSLLGSMGTIRSFSKGFGSSTPMPQYPQYNYNSYNPGYNYAGFFP